MLTQFSLYIWTYLYNGVLYVYNIVPKLISFLMSNSMLKIYIYIGLLSLKPYIIVCPCKYLAIVYTHSFYIYIQANLTYIYTCMHACIYLYILCTNCRNIINECV